MSVESRLQEFTEALTLYEKACIAYGATPCTGDTTKALRVARKSLLDLMGALLIDAARGTL